MVHPASFRVSRLTIMPTNPTLHTPLIIGIAIGGGVTVTKKKKKKRFAKHSLSLFLFGEGNPWPTKFWVTGTWEIYIKTLIESSVKMQYSGMHIR